MSQGKRAANSTARSVLPEAVGPMSRIASGRSSEAAEAKNLESADDADYRRFFLFSFGAHGLFFGHREGEPIGRYMHSNHQ
jgi:hypothetical protein